MKKLSSRAFATIVETLKEKQIYISQSDLPDCVIYYLENEYISFLMHDTILKVTWEILK